MSEEGVSRRSILRGVAVTAVAGVAGYAVATTSDAADSASPATAANASGGGSQAGTRIAALADVPEGGGVIIENPAVVLTRAGSGDLAAFSAICTHQGCPVGSIDGAVIVCPCHASRFDLATGEPVSGPAQRPLPPIAVEVRGEDVFAL